MSQKEYIQVWDPLVRLFHWLLVVFFVVAFLTGDAKSAVHRDAGYVVLGLITVRVGWGFVGSYHARFANFICPPGRAIAYLKEVVQGSPQYYVGHNPAAGWMVLLVLALLFVVCGTGYLAFQEKAQGLAVAAADQLSMPVPYAHADRHDAEEESQDQEEELWEELHEAASYTLLALVLVHITGALVSSQLHHENLVQAMITGKKKRRV